MKLTIKNYEKLFRKEWDDKNYIEDIDERRKRELGIHQQYVMTSFNNLALLLNESLAQMQSQMKSQQPGSGSCSKPGGSGKPAPGGKKPGDQDMKQMLKDQLEQMKKGSNPGGSKPGDAKEGQPGGMGLGNQQVAKIAAQQSVMRRKLEQMRNELNKDGKGSGNKLNPLINELEKQEDNSSQIIQNASYIALIIQQYFLKYWGSQKINLTFH